jgi:hypothetical protein
MSSDDVAHGTGDPSARLLCPGRTDPWPHRSGARQSAGHDPHRRRPHVQDIDGVLAALRTVVDDAACAGDRIGLFAAVYRQVTAAIARGLADGHFDDAERLNRFDAVFAGRYLTALEARRDGRDPGRSWRLSSGRRRTPGGHLRGDRAARRCPRSLTAGGYRPVTLERPRSRQGERLRRSRIVEE